MRTEIIPIPALSQIDASLCRKRFSYFVKYFWDTIIAEPMVWNWHMEYICSELQIVAERVIRRQDKLYDLIINVPPGTSKSTLCTIMLPAWVWLHDPTIKTMAASYSGGLSMDHSVRTRDVIRSEKFQILFPEVQIRRDIDGKGGFQTIQGGIRMSTSVTGTATGKHAHLLIVDDPLNPKGAESDAERHTANEFMDRTLSTRKIDKAITPTILVMQRLHKDDCTGNWLEKKTNIKHICLPAELSKDVNPPELAEHYVDGLLDPVRLNRNMLADLKTSLGSYGYAGQMMQTPAPVDGGIWQKWIIPVDPKDIPERLMYYGTDWDLAYTKNERNSASAYITAGLYGSDMYITDLGFEWLEFPKLIDFMKTQTAPHYIENKASGKSAKQVLTNNGIPAVEVGVDGGADKIARATMATPYAEAGLVYCNKHILDRLYHDSKQGILIFPNGDGDDLQDALVQSINRLLAKGRIEVRHRNVS